MDKLEVATTIIQIISSIVIAGFTIALWYATNTQKNIAKQQYDTEIYKLRLDHLNKLVQAWVKYNSYFVIKDNEIDILFRDRTHADQYRDFYEVIEQIEALKKSAKYIYTETISQKEENLLSVIKEMHELFKSKLNKDDLRDKYNRSEDSYQEILNLLEKEIVCNNAK